MYGFVNELSFAGQAQNLNQCTELIRELTKTINALRPALAGKQVHVSQSLWQQEISPGYTVQKFIYDRNIDQAIKTNFQVYITNGPYFEAFIENISHQCTIISNNQDVTGSSIAAASYLSGVLTSLQNAPPFDLDHVEVRYCDETINEQSLKIINLFDHSVAKDFCANVIKDDTNSWKDFWSQRALLFPELVFCEDVESQLRDVNFNAHYSLISRHLQCMNDYIKNVRTGNIHTPDFEKMGIEATPESGQTLDRKKYCDVRRFKCPDGVERTFSWHSKQRGQNIRIHFYPTDVETKDFIIGYVGEHLPTATIK
ncbi:MAG: hypothetical protein HQL02_01505 [Nitrospirae bacterium]|nr:hypothetical protein [Nitrospirota bacterium]